MPRGVFGSAEALAIGALVVVMLGIYYQRHSSSQQGRSISSKSSNSKKMWQLKTAKNTHTLQDARDSSTGRGSSPGSKRSQRPARDVKFKKPEVGPTKKAHKQRHMLKNTL